MINIQSIILLFTIFLNFIFGLYIFFRNPKNPINKIFFALAISLCIWCASTLLDLYYFNNITLFDFYDRFAYVAGLLIALFFYLFSFLYPYKSAVIFKEAILIYCGILLIFSYVIFTPLFVTDVRLVQGFVVPYHNNITYVIYSLVLITPFIFGVLQLFKKMREGDGVYRKEFPTLITIVVLVILLSLYFDLFLAGVNNNSYISVGPISSLLFIYAIMRMIISKD